MSLKKKSERNREYKETVKKYTKPKNKKLKYLRIFFVFSLLILVSLVILFRSSKFLRVEINGLNRMTTVDVIKSTSIGSFNNKSLFFIPLDEVKKDIERNPLLEVISIKRSIPDMLTINVKEKEAVSLLEYSGNIYEITSDGSIIKQNIIASYDVPYMTGFNIGTNSKYITDDYTKYIIETLYAVKEENKEVYDLISEMNAFGKDLIIYPRSYRAKVLVEKYIKPEKMIKLAAIIKTLKDNDNYVREIDFRFEEAIIKE